MQLLDVAFSIFPPAFPRLTDVANVSMKNYHRNILCTQRVGGGRAKECAKKICAYKWPTYCDTTIHIYIVNIMLKDDINLALGQAQKHDEANGNDTQHIMLIYITNYNRTD